MLRKYSTRWKILFSYKHVVNFFCSYSTLKIKENAGEGILLENLNGTKRIFHFFFSFAHIHIKFSNSFHFYDYVSLLLFSLSLPRSFPFSLSLSFPERRCREYSIHALWKKYETMWGYGDNKVMKAKCRILSEHRRFVSMMQ